MFAERVETKKGYEKNETIAIGLDKAKSIKKLLALCSNIIIRYQKDPN